MTVRLGDEATYLEPAVKVDPYTEMSRPDWDAAPLRSLVKPFQAEPLDSTEAVATASTVITRYRAFLPADLDGVITPVWRIQWDGVTYEVKGDIGRRKSGRTARFLVCVIEAVKG